MCRFTYKFGGAYFYGVKLLYSQSLPKKKACETNSKYKLDFKNCFFSYIFNFSCIICNAVIIFDIECTYSYRELGFEQFDIQRNDLEQKMSVQNWILHKKSY